MLQSPTDTDDCCPSPPLGAAEEAGLPLIGGLFDTSDFPPRWHCGTWSQTHGWVHILADLVIFGAYVAIPFALVFFIRQRKDMPFGGIFWLFGAFIVLCGISHLQAAALFWWPAYRLLGLTKILTAGVSVATVIALIKLIPLALKIPSPSQLQLEIDQRKATELQLQSVIVELQRSNEELDRFAYAASHDLRSPLRAIENLTTWIEEDLEGTLNETSRGYMDQLHVRCDRMQTLLSDLLDYSRVGRNADRMSNIQVEELMRETFNLASSDGKMTLELQGEVPSLYGSRAPLQQVLLNLISNAIKHHDEGSGTLALSWRRLGHEVEFAVTDDGPGIDPKHHGVIFEMFRRVHARPEIEGNGIGLTLVRKIVEARQGSLEVESDGQRGTTIRFTWPLDERSPQASHV